MFQTDERALRGKNFFQLMSPYTRKFCYETFGNNFFKTFKITSKTIRYSLPHMDDIDYDNFKVLTSKVMLVKPKIGSPLKTDPYMVKICSRESTEESKKRLYGSYTSARAKLRAEYMQVPPYVRETPASVSTVVAPPFTREKKSAFDSCLSKTYYQN